MFHRSCIVLLLAGLAAFTATGGELRPATASLRLQAPAGAETARVFIVQLADPPAVSRPRVTRRFDARDPDVTAHAEALAATHDALLASVGAAGSKVYSYGLTFNGFAARLTPSQVSLLRARREVVGIWLDRLKRVETNESPIFLGLYDERSGLNRALGLTGEGVIIGVIDSGITPGHPSFSDTRDGDRPRLCRSSWAEQSLLGLWLCFRFRDRDDQVVYTRPDRWRGACEAGDGFQNTDCNNKLIGARYYIEGFQQEYQLDANEFISPKDADGHGTHIASIAAGNSVRAELAGNDVAQIRGVAPRAYVAAYKACWLEPGQTRGSCSTADLARAIEGAVADGVDIINYSIGSTDVGLREPDDLALLAATEAGVLAVVAAGNDGTGLELDRGTILSPAGAPWVIAVGASSREGQRFEEAMRVDEPPELAGEYAAREASFTPSLRTEGAISGPLVLVDDETLALVDGLLGTTYDACEPVQNEADLSGQIAYLQRGGCTFEVKLRNVESAGAVGALVFNNQGAPIVMSGTRDSVNIPAVMIGQADGQQLLDELNAGGTIEVTLDKALLLQVRDAGDVMAAFSSRGPNGAAPDFIKPDVTAPGEDILGAQARDVANGVRGEDFQYLSGTSMAAPHVAGLAALLKERHPDWSPAMLKSALMTTATTTVVKADGETPADPFDFGAGRVVPNRAVEPGFVYDAGTADYDAFLCGAGQPRLSAEECDQLEADGFPTRAPDLNLPSLAVARLVSEQRVRRRVTAVGTTPAQYSATVEAPAGIAVSVEPPVLSLSPGETAEYAIRLRTRGEPFYDWRFGAISWASGEQVVRTPLAVYALPFAAPLSVSGTGPQGSQSLELRFGYSGDYRTRISGLVPADVARDTVTDDPFNAYRFEPDTALLPSSVRRFVFTVAPRQIYLRIASFDATTAGVTDLDVYAYYCPGLLVCIGDALASGSSGSDEEINVIAPQPGEWIVDVHGFGVDPALGTSGASFELFVWTLGAGDDRGNLELDAPALAVQGTTENAALRWSGLAPGRYLGGIVHNDGEEDLALTLVEIVN